MKRRRRMNINIPLPALLLLYCLARQTVEAFVVVPSLFRSSSIKQPTRSVLRERLTCYLKSQGKNFPRLTWDDDRAAAHTPPKKTHLMPPPPDDLRKGTWAHICQVVSEGFFCSKNPNSCGWRTKGSSTYIMIALGGLFSPLHCINSRDR